MYFSLFSVFSVVHSKTASSSSNTVMGLKIRYFDEDNDDTLNKTLSMTGQPQSLAVFKALGLSDPAAERLHSLWNKKDNKDPSIDICRFVISHIKERQFMAPFVYLIGIDNLATFSMRLGITSELVQQAIDLFKSANNGGLVMGTMRWLEQAIKIRWGRLRDASGTGQAGTEIWMDGFVMV